MHKNREIICGIYKIQSPSGKIYIGKGSDLIKRRWDYASLDCKRQRILYNSIVKYGWDSHTFEVIHQLPNDVSNEVLNTYEILYIQQYQSNINEYRLGIGMNLTIGGDGAKGHRWTEEAKNRYKKTIKEQGLRKGEKSGMWGRTGEKSHRFGIRGVDNPLFGKKATNETRIKLSIARIGNNNSSRKVINTETGDIYISAKKASEKLMIPYRTIIRNLGKDENKYKVKYFK